jgi:phosphate transport system protein
MEKEHTHKIFDDELNHLRRVVQEMMKLCIEQINGGLDALVNQDQELAKQIIERDKEVNAKQQEVDNLTLRLLAMRQPVAKDLRHILTAERMAADLERIADYASNVAKNSLRMEGRKVEGPIQEVVNMGRIAAEMLAELDTCYMALDSKAASTVWARDDEIDDLFAGVFSALSKYMADDPECVGPCLALLNAGRAMERIGDHITNLAEQVYWLATGKNFPVLDSQ